MVTENHGEDAENLRENSAALSLILLSGSL